MPNLCESQSSSSGELLSTTRSEAHPHCFACGAANPNGLALQHVVEPDGSVTSNFAGDRALEGYPTRLHGGVVATILDGAMTNCLFARGIRAVTAELLVRYRAGILASQPLTARAWLRSSRHGLHLLHAEIQQGGAVKATAEAKFLNLPEPGLTACL